MKYLKSDVDMAGYNCTCFQTKLWKRAIFPNMFDIAYNRGAWRMTCAITATRKI